MCIRDRQYGGYQQRTYTGANAALYSQVRQAINQGNLGMAEALLQRAAGRDAEWFYLTGTVYYLSLIHICRFYTLFLSYDMTFFALVAGSEEAETAPPLSLIHICHHLV